MTATLPKFHTLDVWINDEGPFTAVSQLRGGLGLSLFTGMDGFFYLTVRYELDTHTTKTYRLKTLMPGDRLKFTYDGPNDDSGASIEEIEKLERVGEPPELHDRHHLGLDITGKNGDEIRVSRPVGGHLVLTMINVPLDHGRVWVTGIDSDNESSFQLDDLYAGDSLKIEIVTSDRFNEFPEAAK